MRFPLLELAIVACVAGLAYWATNRVPMIAPTIKQIIKIVIVVVGCLIALGLITGRHFLGL